MRSILSEFAKGNIGPDSYTFNRDLSYKSAAQKLAETEEKLLAILTDEQKSVFQAFMDAQGEVGLLSSVERFVCGYRLGALMILEVFEGIDDL